MLTADLVPQYGTVKASKYTKYSFSFHCLSCDNISCRQPNNLLLRECLVFIILERVRLLATYQALYRKYRPQTFDDVSGQLAVTQTLKTQLVSGRMSHAYLFTGSRGTGKTSCAKILAKAVNCLNPDNGNPCNCCSACQAIDSRQAVPAIHIPTLQKHLSCENVMIHFDDGLIPPEHKISTV